LVSYKKDAPYSLARFCNSWYFSKSSEHAILLQVTTETELKRYFRYSEEISALAVLSTKILLRRLNCCILEKNSSLFAGSPFSNISFQFSRAIPPSSKHILPEFDSPRTLTFKRSLSKRNFSCFLS